MEDQIQYIEIKQLKDHPDNPRLFMREEVIEGISAQLEDSGDFDPAHALLVRAMDGYYQIVRGHHRKEAAKRADLTAVPCWVREMTDEEAYMQLALGNVQGELSPLEIGVHACGLELGEKGRGKRGGLGEYARLIGKTQQYISQVRQGAEVLRGVENHKSTCDFIDKAQHLSHIHKTPPDLWPMLSAWLITENEKGKQPSANQVEGLVKSVRKFASALYEDTDGESVPVEWQYIFLPIKDIVRAFMDTKIPNPAQVKALVNTALNLENLIAKHEKELDPDLFPYTVDAFHLWLTEGTGTYAWQVDSLDEYRRGVIASAQEAKKPPKPDAQPGEWWALGNHRLYCGDTGLPAFYDNVDLCAFAFADPPYNANAAEWDSNFTWAHDWLIEKSPIVTVTPGIEAIQSFYTNDTNMPYRWSMAAWINNGQTRGALGFGNWIYIALFASPEMKIHKAAQDFINVSIQVEASKQTEHKGRKPSALMESLIQTFTEPGEFVLDPFLGSGSTLFAADKLNRVCIGGEISPQFCNEIIERWQNATGQAAEKIQ